MSWSQHSALALLPDDVHVVVVGEGPDRDDLERAIAAAVDLVSRVHLVGRVADARDLYRAFDVVVSPSRAEGLPNSVLEAAAAGRAIVATRAGGTAEIPSWTMRPACSWMSTTPRH